MIFLLCMHRNHNSEVSFSGVAKIGKYILHAKTADYIDGKNGLQSKRLKRSCQGWMNEFIIANLISLLVSIVRSSSREEWKTQNKTRSNTRILIGLMNNKLIPYLESTNWQNKHSQFKFFINILFLLKRFFCQRHDPDVDLWFAGATYWFNAEETNAER